MKNPICDFCNNNPRDDFLEDSTIIATHSLRETAINLCYKCLSDYISLFEKTNFLFDCVFCHEFVSFDKSIVLHVPLEAFPFDPSWHLDCFKKVATKDLIEKIESLWTE